MMLTYGYGECSLVISEHEWIGYVDWMDNGDGFGNGLVNCKVSGGGGNVDDLFDNQNLASYEQPYATRLWIDDNPLTAICQRLLFKENQP